MKLKCNNDCDSETAFYVEMNLYVESDFSVSDDHYIECYKQVRRGEMEAICDGCNEIAEVVWEET